MGVLWGRWEGCADVVRGGGGEKGGLWREDNNKSVTLPVIYSNSNGSSAMYRTTNDIQELFNLLEFEVSYAEFCHFEQSVHC